MTATDHGITVTLKYDKGYDAPWAVFKAPSAEAVRADIISYFGLEYASVSELTLHELVVNVTNIAQGGITAATMLNAVAIPATSRAVEEQTDNPWAGLDDEEDEEKKQEANPLAYLFDAIAAATNVEELQRVWVKNQSAFTDEAVVAAYKARGKALSQ